MMVTPADLVRDSLDGLSVGDALGAQFFVPGISVADLVAGRPPAAPWPWTDDTEMAGTVAAETVTGGGRIDQDRLARLFADRCEPYRGYGPGTVVLLHQIRDGAAWRQAARGSFGGQGSLGNGAAMRVAPLGAWHAGDPAAAAEQAARSAEVTHPHPEGVAGAVAVAVAAAHAGRARRDDTRPAPEELLAGARDAVPDGPVRRGLRRAAGLVGHFVEEAGYELGNGSRVTAADTVPFALWAAATFLHDYRAAIVACVRAGGDVDTTSAIVGGIVAAYTGTGDRPGRAGIPADWLAAREALPEWATVR